MPLISIVKKAYTCGYDVVVLRVLFRREEKISGGSLKLQDEL